MIYLRNENLNLNDLIKKWKEKSQLDDIKISSLRSFNASIYPPVISTTPSCPPINLPTPPCYCPGMGA